MGIHAVILVGGPSRGTRFRPLSMNHPKPLFPIAGHPMVYHHIAALASIAEVTEVLLIGFFDDRDFQQFVSETQREFPNLKIRFLREYQSLGTGGGLYLFRDQILRGSPSAVFVMHADVCSSFPLSHMLEFHRKTGALATIMGTRVSRETASKYGCIVSDPTSHQVEHYVEKPESFVSDTISCGIYLFNPQIFEQIEKTVRTFQENKFSDVPSDSEIAFTKNPDSLRLEQDILRPLAGTGKLFLYQTLEFWRQIKTAGSAVPANKLFLHSLRLRNSTLLAEPTPVRSGNESPVAMEHAPVIIGNVFIHPTAKIHESAKLGPNVSIGAGVTIGKGVRVRESIILDNVEVKPFACILFSIIGWESKIGAWARIEGSPVLAGGENVAAQKIIGSPSQAEGQTVHDIDINILGDAVFVNEGVVVRNCIVLPHKELNNPCYNKKILM